MAACEDFSSETLDVLTNQLVELVTQLPDLEELLEEGQENGGALEELVTIVRRFWEARDAGREFDEDFCIPYHLTLQQCWNERLERICKAFDENRDCIKEVLNTLCLLAGPSTITEVFLLPLENWCTALSDGTIIRCDDKIRKRTLSSIDAMKTETEKKLVVMFKGN